MIAMNLPPGLKPWGPRPGHGGPSSSPPWSTRRRHGGWRPWAVLVALAVGGALYLNGPGGRCCNWRRGDRPPPRSRVVIAAQGQDCLPAESQIGYRTDPPGTYCNKYSAFWNSGVDNCGNGNLDEEWCADFAAWVWRRRGAAVTYRFVNGDLNSSAASFYEWGVSRGTWHPVGSGYVPVPGDVAVYGLDIANLVAAHVAIVIGYQPGDRGPTAVNGDGDLTAFSVVEVRADESVADTHPGSAPLAGYVSPSDRLGGLRANR